MLTLKIILFTAIAILFILLCIRASKPEPEPEKSCQHCRYFFYSSGEAPCNRCRRGSEFIRSELEGQEWD
jgi:uncharacterized paraquat-inducible protein A